MLGILKKSGTGLSTATDFIKLVKIFKTDNFKFSFLFLQKLQRYTNAGK